MQISNAGSYRGKIVDHGVSETTNGYPQLVLRLTATQYYDRDFEDGTTDENGNIVKGAWLELGEELDIVGYLCLIDSKGEKTMNCNQVEKALGWNGYDLAELADMALADRPIQFRVKEHEYNNKVSMQVEWIDDFEANPSQGLKKLDTAGIKALQAKYSKAFGPKKVTAVSAPKPVVGTAAPAAPKRGRPASKPVATTPVVETVAAPSQTVTSTTPAKPIIPSRKPVVTTPVKQQTSCTKEEAFDYVSNKEMWKKEVTEEQVAELWINTVTEVAGERPDDEITPEEWFTIRSKIANQVFVF